MTSTYDHRIIQGAESGRFLQRVEALPPGRGRLLRGRLRRPRRRASRRSRRPAPAAAAAAAATAAPSRRRARPRRLDEELLQAVQAATSLLKAHRTHGHLAARLDPLGREPEGDPALDPEPLGLTPELMAQIPARDPAHVRAGRDAGRRAAPPARDLLRHDRLRDRAHRLAPPAPVAAREDRVGHVPPAADQRRAEGAAQAPDRGRRARALHAQGLPGPEAVLGRGPRHDRADARRADPARRPRAGAREVVHRHGPPRPAQRAGPQPRAGPTRRSSPSSRAPRRSSRSPRSRRAAPATSSTTTAPRAPTSCQDGESIIVRLESNPSPPRVRRPGRRPAPPAPRRPPARARTPTRTPTRRSRSILHGDAAFPGQGVVAETLNLQALDGYTVGGTIHLIQNNQVGFTTDPDDARSTRWASDLAKGFDVPIIHVNADDVAACVSAVRLAFAFRQEFGHDVADRPDRLPPLRPQRGRRARLHPARDVPGDQEAPAGARALRRASWSTRAWSPSRRPTEMTDEVWAVAHRRSTRSSRSGSPRAKDARARHRRVPARPHALARGQDRGLRRPPARSLNEELLAVPDGFTVHPKLVKQLEQRREALGRGGGIVWAHAESLAFASLLTEGIPIRLTGQDTERGTFCQRHLVLHDPKTGQEHCADPAPARARWRRWSCTTARCRRWPASASSTATRRRRPRRWCCGRPSSATSSTAPR